MGPIPLTVWLVFGPPGRAIGVAWHEQATADAELRQRLTAELARSLEVPVETIEPDVVRAARERIARALPRAVADEHALLRAAYEAAERAFLGGDFERAARAVDALERATAARTVVPGVSRLRFRLHVLRARIAALHGDRDVVARELTAAWVLDPEAVLSAREVPPELAEIHADIRRVGLAGRERWRRPELALPAGVVDPTLWIEIDGVPGVRPIPAGEHVVVVHRAGRASLGRLARTDELWHLDEGPELLGVGTPIEREPAERVCEALALDAFVIASVAGDRLGLQHYRCGHGFGPAWTGERTAIAQGVARGAIGGGRIGARAVLAMDPAWPAAEAPAGGPTPRPGGPQAAVDRPERGRAWIWIVAGVLAAGALGLGLGLGLSERDGAVRIDTASFR